MDRLNTDPASAGFFFAHAIHRGVDPWRYQNSCCSNTCNLTLTLISSTTVIQSPRKKSNKIFGNVIKSFYLYIESQFKHTIMKKGTKKSVKIEKEIQKIIDEFNNRQKNKKKKLKELFGNLV
ncbi:MAG: hypothetical protein ABFD07_06855 [Methanobacterium sp.]